MPTPVLPRSCAELGSARATAEQQEYVLAAKRSEMAALLEEERLGRAEALLRQREAAEAARRELQVRRVGALTPGHGRARCS